MHRRFSGSSRRSYFAQKERQIAGALFYARGEPGCYQEFLQARGRYSGNSGLVALSGAEDAQLGQGGHSIIKTDLLEDLAILYFEDGGACEAHLPARICRQGATQEVLERRAGMSSAAPPLADDIIPFSDEVSRSPEVEVRKRRAEICHESLDVFASLPWLMQ